jgi:hypothetical protein
MSACVALGRGRAARRRCGAALRLVFAAVFPAIGAAACTSRAQEPPASALQAAPVTAGGGDTAPAATVAIPDDLRRRVDELVAVVEREPSTPANASQRIDVVWEWANTLARAGVVPPPDLPPTIAYLRWAERDGWRLALPPGMDLSLEDQFERLDGYVRELARLQRGLRPGRLELRCPGSASAAGAAGGSSTATRDGCPPLVSRSVVTLEQVYTVGDRPIRTGGALLLGTTLGGGPEGRVQHADASAANYVTARASRAGVVLEPTMVPWNGVTWGFLGTTPAPAFRVASGVLARGDTVIFTIGDRAHGSPGFGVPTFATDRYLFPVYVDAEGTGDFFALEWPAATIVGAAGAARARVLAPSVVALGEAFSLTVRTEDDAMNRASGPIPAYDVLLASGGGRAAPRAGDGGAGREGSLGRIAAGGPAVAVLEDVRLDAPGVHRFIVRSADGRLTATSNPVWAVEAPRQRILWGDTHGHTGFAEGQGSPRSFFSYAVEDARLDFVTLSEHDLWMDDGEWQVLQELAREFSRPGRFVPILGYEWTAFNERGGHHNVFFRDPAAERVGVHDAVRLPELYRGLHRRYRPDELLVIPHAHIAGDWRQSDPELERLVELYSTHGTFEWFANAYLRNGFELGFVAASDTHLAKPGLMPPPLGVVSQRGGLVAVQAPTATAEEIFPALRELRTYATSGQRIVLDASLNGHPMGSRQPRADFREVRVRVHGTAPIERIDVLRNGEVVLSRPYLDVPLAARSVLQVAFESSSEVSSGVRDDPRGSRPWRGTLAVQGASVVGVDPVAVDNLLRERVALEDVPHDPSRPGSAERRVRFAILTRGRADSFLLELDGATAATTLRFALEPGKEAGAPFTLRGEAEIPAASFELALDALEDGRVERELRVGEHVDRVSVRVIDRHGPLDRELEFVDLDRPTDGDYYYVRVAQLDGGMAWSSPWWVGGTDRAGDRQGVRAGSTGRDRAGDSRGGVHHAP